MESSIELLVPHIHDNESTKLLPLQAVVPQIHESKSPTLLPLVHSDESSNLSPQVVHGNNSSNFLPQALVPQVHSDESSKLSPQVVHGNNSSNFLPQALVPQVLDNESMIPQHNESELSKKKRTSRKRNRSDMSPEELRRLRERERKAQQNRRDRLRAQKKQAQFQNTQFKDENAWQTFLQTNNDDGSCRRALVNGETVPSMINLKHTGNISPIQNTINQNGSAYSSDDNSSQDQSSIGTLTAVKEPTKHYLLPKEIDNIQYHRERESYRHNVKAIKQEEYEYIRELPLKSKYEDFQIKLEHSISRSPERKLPINSSFTPTRLVSPKMIDRITSPDNHRRLPFDIRSISSPHDRPFHYSSIYSSPYLKEGRHFAELHYPYSSERYLSESSRHYNHHHHSDARAINRNLDRKKLSEEELDEVRRRDRDYQRERRTEMRLEKSKIYRNNSDAMLLYHSSPILHSRSEYEHNSPNHHRYIRSENKLIENVDIIKTELPQVKKEVFDKRNDTDVDMPKLEVDVSNEVRSKDHYQSEQVVPKDYEEMKNEKQSPEFHLQPSSRATLYKQKSRSPKSENNHFMINYDISMERMSLLSQEYSTKLDMEENKSIVRDIKEDQLERRRRSNREAQRRRRARMKMMEGRPSSLFNNENQEPKMNLYTEFKDFNHHKTEEDDYGKKCRIKVTPNRTERIEEYPHHINKEHYPTVLRHTSHHHNHYHDIQRKHYHHHNKVRHYIENQYKERENKDEAEIDNEMTETVVVKPNFEEEISNENEVHRSRKRKQAAPRKFVATNGAVVPDNDNVEKEEGETESYQPEEEPNVVDDDETSMFPVSDEMMDSKSINSTINSTLEETNDSNDDEDSFLDIEDNSINEVSENLIIAE